MLYVTRWNRMDPDLMAFDARPATAGGRLSEYQKVGVIFSGMDLRQHPADAGPVVTHEHKQVFNDKSLFGQRVDDFHVGEPLLVGAHFIGAFDDVDAVLAQHA